MSPADKGTMQIDDGSPIDGTGGTGLPLQRGNFVLKLPQPNRTGEKVWLQRNLSPRRTTTDT
jgi:hypothetical protein